MRSKPIKFNINAAYDMLEKLANRMHLKFEWSGKLYPKTKRSHGPNQDSLNMHAEVLEVLIQLAPNGYPDGFLLRDLLIKLHAGFRIFDENTETHLSIGSRAMLAADRWRIMCKHCRMLAKTNSPCSQEELKKVVVQRRMRRHLQMRRHLMKAPLHCLKHVPK